MVEVLFDSAKLPAIWSGAEKQIFGEFAKSHVGVSLMDFIPAGERAAIRAFTSTYDCAADLEEAIAATGTLGGTIYVPFGRYTLGSRIDLHKRIKFLGDGSMFGSSSLFRPTHTGPCFVIHRSDTGETGREVWSTSAAGTIFEGISWLGAAGTGTATQHCVWMRAPAIMRHCLIDTFGGNGVHVDCDLTSGDGFLYGDAKGFVLDTVRAARCLNGVYTNGPDVSGYMRGCNLQVNRNYGQLHEGSGVITDLGTHSATNTEGACYFGDDVYGTCLGFYTEQGQSPGNAQIGAKSIGMGGLHGTFMGLVSGEYASGVLNSGGVGSRFSSLIQGQLHNGFFTTIGTTPNRQSLALFRNGNFLLRLNAEGDSNDAYTLLHYTGTQEAYRRLHGTSNVLEYITCDLGPTASASSRLKDEAGTTIVSGHLVYPRSKYLPSLSDSGEYRRFQYTSGNLAAVSYLATGDFTLASTDPLAGAIVIDCGGAGRTVTLPTAALLVSVIRNTPIVGQTIECQIANGSDAAETITIAAGTGGTWDSNQTASSRVIPRNRSKILRLRLTNVTAASEAYTINL